ncbi:MAG: Non-specific serine/threonine protein kinase [uncultured bacterium]|nr:MAG: Non-specific serine/threonine protein kinase [uncultured bacterium]
MAGKQQNTMNSLLYKLSIKQYILDSYRDIRDLCKYHKPAIIWITALLGIILSSFFFPFFDGIEYDTFDIRLKQKKNNPQSKEIVITEINDDCKTLFAGTWPWSRKIHAQLISSLQKFYDPKMIIFDILFIGSSNDLLADKALAVKVKSAGNAYFPFTFMFSEESDKSFSLRVEGKEEPYEELKKNLKGFGHVNFKEDRDGKLRRIPLLIKENDIWIPHLAFKVALDYLNITLDKLEIIPGKFIKFKDNSGKNYKIPVDNECQLILNWPGKWVDTFKHISAVDVIQTNASQVGEKSRINPENYKGKIFIIGDTTTGTVDVRSTPFDKRCPLVNAIAAIINQILLDTHIYLVPKWINLIFCIMVIICVGIIAINYNPLRGLIIAMLIFLLIALFSTTLLIYFNIWFEIARPLITVILTFFILGTYSHVRFKDHVDLKLSFEQKLSMADAKLPQFKANLKIGNYSDISELGRGGMAIVYKGIGKDGKKYAIKVINPECLTKDKLFKYRFKREIATMKKVVHSNVIRIYDSGSFQGVLYYAMELFPAGDLGEHIPQLSKSKDWKFIAKLFYQLIDGMKAIHDANLIHRDIKPANIMMNDNNEVKIADFGLARQVEEGQILTTVGQVLGTPAYLSPELCMGDPPDFSADIYAMGIIFYEIATGYRPFQECATMAALMQSKMKSPIPSVMIKNPELPKELIKIVDKMVAFKVTDRYKKCEEILNELTKII